MGQRGPSYGECLKAHAHMGGKIDGCQEFKATNDGEECSICNCHMNYHRRLAEIVYMECHKNHNVNGSNVKDDCKEYIENECSPNKCAACNCHKSFHRNEVIIRRWENRASTGVQGRGCEKHADKYSKDNSRKGDSKLGVKNQTMKAKQAAKVPNKPCKLVVKKQTKKEKQAAKDPNKPKRPASAFFVFMEDYRVQYKKEHPNNRCVAYVGKAGGDKWKSMSVEEKAPYVAKANKRREEYNRNMEAYNRKLAGGDDGNDGNDESDEDDKSTSGSNDDDDDESGEDDKSMSDSTSDDVQDDDD